MNPIQPAAHARAVTGFRDSRAGTRNIAHFAWNRSVLWLLVRFLPLVMLTCWNAAPAHADGVKGTISSGQTVNGTIIGTGVDNYTFQVTAGSSFVVSVGETGPHDATFMPRIDLVAPGGIDGPGIWRPLHARLVETNAAEGTWSVKVSRAEAGGTTGGTYALTLIQLPGIVSPSASIAGGAMSPGANSGSNVRGQVDVWIFDGVAGQTKTLTLNQTGGAGFFPEMNVFAPTGSDAGGIDCLTSCSLDVAIKTSGVYTVLAWRKDSADVTGKYTLSVNDKN
jgi:hypothetical protein